MADAPCLTCNEEYELMVEAQALRKAQVREWQAKQTGAERYFVERAKEPSYAEAYEAARADIAVHVNEASPVPESVTDDAATTRTQPVELAEDVLNRLGLVEVEEPAKNASRQDWIDYVVSTGVDPEKLEGKSRNDLVGDYAS